MINVSFTGSWQSTSSTMLNLHLRLRRAQQKALIAEAKFWHKEIVEGIRSQAPGGKRFLPLSPFTLFVRRMFNNQRTTALIEYGDLLRAIKVNKISDDVVMVGIMRGAQNREGSDLIKVGLVQEYGATRSMRVTGRMRNFLRMVMRKMKQSGMHSTGTGGGTRGGYLNFVIPPRPFLGPIWDLYGTNPSQINARFREHMKKEMLGVLF
jgi:hypothetical protein